MPYTQEQIEEALSHIRNCYVIVGKCEQKPYKVKNSTYGDMIYSSGGECTIDLKADIDIILAALEATGKERDDGEKMSQALKKALLKVDAYVAKLEKAGDGMRAWDHITSAYVNALDDWDAARKEKP